MSYGLSIYKRRCRQLSLRSVDTRIHEWWTENDLVRGGGSLNSGATLIVAWKHYVLTQDSRFMDRDLIPGPPEYDIR
jgi:hypothetical protein